MTTTMRKIFIISMLIIMMFTFVACDDDVKDTSKFPEGLSPTFFRDPEKIMRNIKSHGYGYLTFYDMHHPENTDYYINDCEWAIQFYVGATYQEQIGFFKMLSCKDAIGLYESYKRNVANLSDGYDYCVGLYKNYVICFDSKLTDVFMTYDGSNDSVDENQQED